MTCSSLNLGLFIIRLLRWDGFYLKLWEETGLRTQSKTQKPAKFELANGTRKSIAIWLRDPRMIGQEFLRPGRLHESVYISTRQYARLVREWVQSIGLGPSTFGTHSMRRANVAQIYRKTGNLRAVQLLLGHTKMDSTVRYLGFELEDAVAICEAIEI